VGDRCGGGRQWPTTGVDGRCGGGQLPRPMCKSPAPAVDVEEPGDDGRAVPATDVEAVVAAQAVSVEAVASPILTVWTRRHRRRLVWRRRAPEPEEAGGSDMQAGTVGDGGHGGWGRHVSNKFE
jgi:hypothetical protein